MFRRSALSFVVTVLIACNQVLGVAVSSANACVWCDPVMSENFMDCLCNGLKHSSIFNDISRGTLEDMQNSLLAASGAMTRTPDDMKMKIMAGAMSGELTGMIMGSGDPIPASYQDAMRISEECYTAATGNSGAAFVAELGRSVKNMIKDVAPISSVVVIEESVPEQTFNEPISSNQQPQITIIEEQPYQSDPVPLPVSQQSPPETSFSSSFVFQQQPSQTAVIPQTPPAGNSYSGASAGYFPQTSQIAPAGNEFPNQFVPDVNTFEVSQSGNPQNFQQPPFIPSPQNVNVPNVNFNQPPSQSFPPSQQPPFQPNQQPILLTDPVPISQQPPFQPNQQPILLTDPVPIPQQPPFQPNQQPILLTDPVPIPQQPPFQPNQQPILLTDPVPISQQPSQTFDNNYPGQFINNHQIATPNSGQNIYSNVPNFNQNQPTIFSDPQPSYQQVPFVDYSHPNQFAPNNGNNFGNIQNGITNSQKSSPTAENTFAIAQGPAANSPPNPINQYGNAPANNDFIPPNINNEYGNYPAQNTYFNTVPKQYDPASNIPPTYINNPNADQTITINSADTQFGPNQNPPEFSSDPSGQSQGGEEIVIIKQTQPDPILSNTNFGIPIAETFPTQSNAGAPPSSASSVSTASAATNDQPQLSMGSPPYLFPDPSLGNSGVANSQPDYSYTGASSGTAGNNPDIGSSNYFYSDPSVQVNGAGSQPNVGPNYGVSVDKAPGVGGQSSITVASSASGSPQNAYFPYLDPNIGGQPSVTSQGAGSAAAASGASGSPQIMKGALPGGSPILNDNQGNGDKPPLPILDWLRNFANKGAPAPQFNDPNDSPGSAVAVAPTESSPQIYPNNVGAINQPGNFAPGHYNNPNNAGVGNQPRLLTLLRPNGNKKAGAIKQPGFIAYQGPDTYPSNSFAFAQSGPSAPQLSDGMPNGPLITKYKNPTTTQEPPTSQPSTDSPKACAMKFAETLYVTLVKDDRFSCAFGTGTPHDLAVSAASQAIGQGLSTSGYPGYSSEASTYAGNQVGLLPPGATTQAYGEKISKSTMAPLYKYQVITGNCVDMANSIAQNILNALPIITDSLAPTNANQGPDSPNTASATALAIASSNQPNSNANVASVPEPKNEQPNLANKNPLPSPSNQAPQTNSAPNAVAAVAPAQSFSGPQVYNAGANPSPINDPHGPKKIRKRIRIPSKSVPDRTSNASPNSATAVALAQSNTGPHAFNKGSNQNPPKSRPTKRLMKRIRIPSKSVPDRTSNTSPNSATAVALAQSNTEPHAFNKGSNQNPPKSWPTKRLMKRIRIPSKSVPDRTSNTSPNSAIAVALAQSNTGPHAFNKGSNQNPSKSRPTKRLMKKIRIPSKSVPDRPSNTSPNSATAVALAQSNAGPHAFIRRPNQNPPKSRPTKRLMKRIRIPSKSVPDRPSNTSPNSATAVALAQSNTGPHAFNKGSNQNPPKSKPVFFKRTRIPLLGLPLNGKPRGPNASPNAHTPVPQSNSGPQVQNGNPDFPPNNQAGIINNFPFPILHPQNPQSVPNTALPGSPSSQATSNPTNPDGTPDKKDKIFKKLFPAIFSPKNSNDKSTQQPNSSPDNSVTTSGDGYQTMSDTPVSTTIAPTPDAPDSATVEPMFNAPAITTPQLPLNSPPAAQPLLTPNFPPAGQPPLLSNSPTAGQPPLASNLPLAGQPPLTPNSPPAAQHPLTSTLPPAGQPILQSHLPPAGQPPLTPNSSPAGQPPLESNSPPVEQPPLTPNSSPAGQPPLQSNLPPTGQPPLLSNAPPAEQPPLTPNSSPAGQPPLQSNLSPAGQPPLTPNSPPAGQPPLESNSPSVEQPPLTPNSSPAGQPPLESNLPPAGQPPLLSNAPPAAQPPLTPSSPPAEQPPLESNLPPAGQPPISNLPPAGQPPLLSNSPPAEQPLLTPNSPPAWQPPLNEPAAGNPNIVVATATVQNNPSSPNNFLFDTSNSEAQDQLKILMQAGMDSISPTGFNYNHFIGVMTTVASDMANNHPDFSADKCFLKTNFLAIVALSEDLQKVTSSYGNNQQSSAVSVATASSNVNSPAPIPNQYPTQQNNFVPSQTAFASANGVRYNNGPNPTYQAPVQQVQNVQLPNGFNNAVQPNFQYYPAQNSGSYNSQATANGYGVNTPQQFGFNAGGQQQPATFWQNSGNYNSNTANANSYY